MVNLERMAVTVSGGDSNDTVSMPAVTQQLTSSQAGQASYDKIIFMSSVIVIGLVGCCANGVVLRAFLCSTIASKAVNKLLLNQIALDLFASIFLVASYGAIIADRFYTYSNNAWGAFMCKILANAMMPFWGLGGSIAGLVLITLDRYFKIVFPIAHRKHFSNWMIYVGIGISWISGFLLEMSGIWTSGVSAGKCYKFYFWPSIRDRTLSSAFMIVLQYFIPVGVFGYCYGHILFALRKKSGRVSHMQIATTDVTASETKKPTSTIERSQVNIIKTMITISIAFLVCCSPNQFLYLLVMSQATNLQTMNSFYYFTVFLIFCNVAVNPFIYATKHDAVKHQLAIWFGKRSSTSKEGPSISTAKTDVTIPGPNLE